MSGWGIFFICLAIYFGLTDAARVLAKAYLMKSDKTVCEARHE